MKPRKKYIREELIKEIEADIEKTEKELKKHWIALRNAILGDFNIKIEDYEKALWHVGIKLSRESVGLGNDYRKYLFINKKTGKNKYPIRRDKK